MDQNNISSFKNSMILYVENSIEPKDVIWINELRLLDSKLRYKIKIYVYQQQTEYQIFTRLCEILLEVTPPGVFHTLACLAGYVKNARSWQLFTWVWVLHRKFLRNEIMSSSDTKNKLAYCLQ